MVERARRLNPAGCSKRVQVAPNAPGFGAGVAICTGTPRGRFYGHSGWMSAHGTSRLHYADQGVAVPFQINSPAGVVEDSHLLPAPAAALVDVAIGTAR